MKTHHSIFYSSSADLKDIEDESIALVCTSPPYPVIEMWDEIFFKQNPDIKISFEENDVNKIFQQMHNVLDEVWKELYRVVIPGGIICINIGDATRTINKNFQLFNNHSRISNYINELGFQSLPEIVWRKPTNSPNKFMGSGMLPPGAYITLEHEYILIFRKGNKREFKGEAINQRRESAYFWEERNEWFSDLWSIRGTTQNMKTDTSRKRSGAYPFEIAYRLINMFSIKGDTILDPFLGTGTTIIGSIASERNSIGFEIDLSMKEKLHSNIIESKDFINKYITKRIENHKIYIKERIELKGDTKYINEKLNTPVVTNQEREIALNKINSIISLDDDRIEVSYVV